MLFICTSQSLHILTSFRARRMLCFEWHTDVPVLRRLAAWRLLEPLCDSYQHSHWNKHTSSRTNTASPPSSASKSNGGLSKNFKIGLSIGFAGFFAVLLLIGVLVWKFHGKLLTVFGGSDAYAGTASDFWFLCYALSFIVSLIDME